MFCGAARSVRLGPKKNQFETCSTTVIFVGRGDVQMKAKTVTAECLKSRKCFFAAFCRFANVKNKKIKYCSNSEKKGGDAN